MSYTVLQCCNNGHRLTLAPANYGESFPTYSRARAFAKRTNFLYGIVRTDRVYQVTRRYEAQNN